MNGKAGILILIILVVVSLCSCKKQITEKNEDSKGGGDNPAGNTAAADSGSSEAGGSSAEDDNSAAKLALINCSIIDGSGSFLEKDGVILINGEKIEQTGSSDEVKIPENYEIIDLNGRTVLPGFINCHVHGAYSETHLKDWLKGGVTTVRDLGPQGVSNDKIVSLRDDFNKRADTARVISGTPILTVPGGYGSGCFSTADEAEKVVRDYIDLGADVIKFSMCDYQEMRSYEVPTKEEWQALVDTAHAGGKRAVVHITQAKYLPIAAEIGVDEIVHMVSEPIDEKICQTLIDKDIWWIPTLELWKGVDSKYPNHFEDITTKNLGIFYKAGGKIALGTDFNGFPYGFDKGFPISEVQLMKEAGMTNMDIILAVKKNAAIVCGREKDLGTIEAGKIADLLVVDGNPLDKIEDLQNTYMVIHNGQIAVRN